MLVIRLARTGRSKYPTYRIVAAESARAATGKFVEVLGHYNPHTKELVIQKERIEERLSHGAQPSNTVIKLLQREKVELPGWAELKTRDRKPKKEPEVKAETPPAAPDEAAADTEAQDAPADETAATETSADDEVRVAEAATENAEAVEDNATPAGKTETVEDDDKAADAAKAVEAAGAEAADNAAAEAKASSDADASSDGDKS